MLRNAWYWLRNTYSLLRAGYSYKEIRAAREAGHSAACEEFDWDNEENFGERPF